MSLGAKAVRGKRKGVRQARSLSARWLALVAAVLVAFLSQSFVTQTHRHWDPAATSAVTAAQSGGAAQQSPGRQSPADLPDNCPICRALAHAGPVLLPMAVAIDVPSPVSFWRAAASNPGLSLAGRSHAWQSRAPPSQLQA